MLEHELRCGSELPVAREEALEVVLGRPQISGGLVQSCASKFSLRTSMGLAGLNVKPIQDADKPLAHLKTDLRPRSTHRYSDDPAFPPGASGDIGTQSPNGCAETLSGRKVVEAKE